MDYAQKIHSKRHRVLTCDLASPESRVSALFYVPKLEWLAILAAELESFIVAGGAPANFISTNFTDASTDRNQIVQVTFANGTFAASNPEFQTLQIRPSVWCKVIYLPPVYLVHVPGLLDQSAAAAMEQQESRAKRFKPGPTF